jgi:hypothetical protein
MLRGDFQQLVEGLNLELLRKIDPLAHELQRGIGAAGGSQRRPDIRDQPVEGG